MAFALRSITFKAPELLMDAFRQRMLTSGYRTIMMIAALVNFFAHLSDAELDEFVERWGRPVFRED